MSAHAPHTLRGPIGNCTLVGSARMAAPPQFRHTLHALRSPRRRSTEGDTANDGIHNCISL
eukprot:1232300-Pyramimonas_sp.AAC.1